MIERNSRPSKRFMKDCAKCGERFRPKGKYATLCDKCFIKNMHTKRGIRVEKVIHKVWEERQKAKANGMNIRKLIGKWQYIYKSSKGEASLIQTVPILEGNMIWELGYKKNKKIDSKGEFNTERFPTKHEAYERVRELLI